MYGTDEHSRWYDKILYICKAEKTKLNDKVVLGGLCVFKRTIADKLQRIGALHLLCLKDN